MSASPLVSVVMPAHNAAAFLSESIGSVLQQTYTNWELFLIDDASTDGTFAIMQRHEQQDSRIRIIRLTTNQGAGIARNFGIEAAKGDYISFLDADDLWLPHKLETQLSFMMKNNVEVSFSSYDLLDEAGKSLNRRMVALKELSPQKILRANYIGNLTGIYHAKSLGKIYCDPMRKRQDWYLWIGAVEKAGGAFGMEEPLALYRIRKRSLSRRKLEMLPYNYRIYREALKYSYFKSGHYFLRFLIEQLFVKSRQQLSLRK